MSRPATTRRRATALLGLPRPVEIETRRGIESFLTGLREELRAGTFRPLAVKERAIARTAPLGTKPGRYRPSDALLAFLEGL